MELLDPAGHEAYAAGVRSEYATVRADREGRRSREARLTLGWRSAYFTQIGRLGANQMTADFTQLDASLSYAITDKVKLQLEGTNLLDETYYSYVGQESQPYYLYKNGRGYMLSVHFTL